MQKRRCHNRMENKMLRCCAFTGHRPYKLLWKYNEADERCVALKETLTKQITALIDAGVTDFYSGGADGVDCWAALIVLELKKRNPVLRLHSILPHEGQADKWNDFARERYHSILKQADTVEYVSHAYYDGCMIDRNHRLVDSSDLLLAVYNGVRRSGTGATVNYARKMGREIIVIDPITQHIRHEGPVSDLKR